ncbi:MarR family transcriptional regulator [Pedococcus bigeumensis]|uniref:MarR family winged helix-turn-helix transcriptional regulator n=1 Tax=Pedococcus bigeumensis TaxID=433644 RepID=UPI0031D85499
MTEKVAHADDDPARQADAVMRASRVLVGVVAKSLVELEDKVSLPQWRVLVLLATRGRLNLGQLAGALGVHPSNATRTVEKLVVAGFVERADDPQDRRFLVLDLTRQGHDIVERVMGHRRASIVAVMENMTSSRRRALARAFEAFAEAAGEEADGDEGYVLGLST